MGVLLAALPSLIGLAEKLFPKETVSLPGITIQARGPEKKKFVTDLLRANLEVMAAHDVIPDWMAGDASDAVLDLLVEWAYSHWKLNGAATG